MFLGIACLTVAIGSAAFTKANSKLIAPDYYYFTQAGQPDVCVLAPDFQCEPNTTADCVKDVSSTQTNKQIYDNATCTQKLQIKP